MANFEQMSRVLFNHIWDDARQWASALEHLADLNDMEIAVLTHGSAESNTREFHSAEMQDGN
jgi:hypothetical protein